jgi:hypothetical protein
MGCRLAAYAVILSASEMGFQLMNRTSRRARAIAIAQTQDNARLMLARLLMLATGATAACLGYMVFHGL